MPALPRPAPRRTVYRPASAAVAAAVWAAVTLGWGWLALREGGAPALLRQAPAMTLAGTVVYAVLVRPAVEVDRDGVRLRNVVRDVVVPWSELARVSTRFALTLHTCDGRSVRAWAAPAPGRHVDARLTAGEVKALGGDPDDGPPTASASTASPSGAAAAWVRREWRRASADDDAASVSRATGAGVTHRTARGPVAWLAASAVLTALSVLL